MTEEKQKDYSSFYLLHFDIIPGLSFGFSNFNYPGSLFSFYFKDPRFLQRYLQLIIENEDDDEDSSLFLFLFSVFLPLLEEDDPFGIVS